MALAWNRLVTRVRRATPISGDNFFLILSVLIGVLSGLAVVAFRRAIDLTSHWLFGGGAPISPAALAAEAVSRPAAKPARSLYLA